MTYIAQVGLTNDKTGKTYAAGEEVTVDDFPVTVIDRWLELGLLTVLAVDVTEAVDATEAQPEGGE